MNKNEQKSALFGPFFCTPLRVWCYVDNLYLVFRHSSEEFFRCRLTQIDADLLDADSFRIAYVVYRMSLEEDEE